MPADAMPAVPRTLSHRRRWAGVLAAAATAHALSAAPAELAQALQRFRPDSPPGWSYTQTTSAEGRSTVEHSDATKPGFDRWTLVGKDGRAPTPAEIRDYQEARSRRSRGGTAPKLVDQLDLATAEPATRDTTRATFRCRLKPAESGDRVAAFLRATVVVHLASGTVESIELRSTGPFRPTFGVKITEMLTRLTYSPPAGDRPSLPQRVETVVRGTAFWFKSLDAEMTVVFSDYTRATPPRPRGPPAAVTSPPPSP